MKIGILSMQHVLNHGSFLQSYALMETIKKLDAEVWFIKIKPGETNGDICTTRKSEFKKNKKFKNIVNRLYIKQLQKKQRALFTYQQRQYLKLDEVSAYRYDCAVIGSDEVFNCVSPSYWGFSTQLYGEIGEADKIITYAASCGGTTLDHLNNYYINKIRDSLRNISAFSVRDKNTEKFVKKISGVEPLTHLDPVFIYSFQNELIECAYRKPFILVYSYINRFNDPNEIIAIRKFAKENDLEIVSAGVFQFWCHHNIPVNSFELLGYVLKASYIVTDTFHGTVLAIKYNKSFVTFVRGSNSNKVVDLLQKFHLESRILSDQAKLGEILKENIAYDAINVLIENETSRTINYLKDNIKGLSV